KWIMLLSSEFYRLKGITLPIGLNNGQFPFPSGFGIPVFHADYTAESLFVDVPKYVLVVDLPRGGFLSAGIVAHLKIGYFIPTGIDIGNEVAFLDLLVVYVKKNLATGTVHSLADLIGLGTVREEESGVVPKVQGFQDHDDPVGLQKGRGPFKAFHHMG